MKKRPLLNVDIRKAMVVAGWEPCVYPMCPMEAPPHDPDAAIVERSCEFHRPLLEEALA